ncbi:MAG: hypothetical protein JO332_14860 [Planctomycetaceae bacterium]|nr:hypothetical protein [Planctomycetaceae bacterium]
MGFWFGVAFLIACGLGVPVFRKLAHASMLQRLGWDGASVIPSTWGLSGLRVKRPRWEGEVAFEPAGVGGGGRRGHLRLVASLGRKTPSFAVSEKGRRDDAAATEPAVATGDAAFDARLSVRGDADFIRRLLDAPQRERLLRLHDAGGCFRGLSGGVAELDGPLPAGAADLKGFLDQCDAILDAMAGAVVS